MATDDFLKLENKYLGFVSPVFMVKINDKEMEALFSLGDITVELTAKYEASVCRFFIKNAFEVDGVTKIELSSDLNQLIQLGNKVEVSLGYKEAGLVHVFSGYIDRIDVDYDKNTGIVYSVECLDGKGIMMNSYRSEAKVGMEKYSDAVESVLKKYTSVLKISTEHFDKSDAVTTNIIEQHNESDYNFVVRMAEKLNYCFFIEKGTVYFKPFVKLSKDPIFAFHINQYMYGFHMHASLKNLVSSVMVRANDEKDETKFFEGKANQFESNVETGSGSPKIATLINDVTTKTFVDLSVDSEQRAKELAQGKLNEISYGMYRGTVKTVGMPELFPGKVVTMLGFGDGYDQKYYVAKVKHKIYKNAYTTECELEVNKK